MNHILKYITSITFAILFAMAHTLLAQQPNAPVKLDADQPNVFAPEPAQNYQGSLPPQGLSQMMPQQNMQQQPQLSAEEAAKVAAEQAAKKAAENIKKYSYLLPDINEILPSIELTFWEVYWWIFLFIAIAIVVIFILMFSKSKAPIPTAFEIAIARLAKDNGYLSTLEAKEYAQEISQAVRDYIEAVHNLPAPERTTEEFLKIASNAQDFDETQHKLLTNILKLADKAKFAKHSFQTQEREDILKDSVEFVEYDYAKLNQQDDSKTESKEEKTNASDDNQEGDL